MARYLMTHSLLSSWLYAMKDSPFEDATSERDAFGEFLQVLRREPTPTTEAMQKGIDFEDLVTAIVRNDAEGMRRNPDWYDAAKQIAQIVGGGSLQHRARKVIAVSGMMFVIYGRLDALKAGTIYDIKFSGSYDRGEYFDSTQHPMYFDLVPEANDFVYLVSNGNEVYRERYRRDETADITVTIGSFVSWLTANGLLETYKRHWQAL